MRSFFAHLYFEVLEHPPGIRVFRMKSPSATFFHGTEDTIPTDSAIEELGVLSRQDAMERGFVRNWSTAHDWKAVIAGQLDKLSDVQRQELSELVTAQQSGFGTKFLQDLNEVK